MTYVKLDDGFFANPKVAQAGYEGAGLYAMGLSYCGKYLTDGFLPEFWAHQHPRRIIKRLLDAKLWRVVDGGYVMADYLEYNRSAEEIKEERRKKREGGKRGAEERWAREQAEAQAVRKAIAGSMAYPIADPTGASDAPDQTRPDQGLRESVSSTPDQKDPRRASPALADQAEPILAVIDKVDANTEPLIRELCARLPRNVIDVIALEVERTQNVRKSKTALAVRLLQKRVDRMAAA